MNFFLECTVGMLAAAGLICIVKSLYDIIVTDYLADGLQFELIIYGDGSDPQLGRFLQALSLGRLSRIGMDKIYFTDTGIRGTVCGDQSELPDHGCRISVR